MNEKIEIHNGPAGYCGVWVGDRVLAWLGEGPHRAPEPVWTGPAWRAAAQASRQYDASLWEVLQRLPAEEDRPYKGPVTGRSAREDHYHCRFSPVEVGR